MDGLHKLLKWVDHNRVKAFGIVLALFLCVYAGCAVKTASLKDPTVKVTAPVYAQEAAVLRAGLEAEAAAINLRIKAFNEREDIGYGDLKAKQAQKEAVIGVVSTATLSAARAAGIPVPESAGKIVLGLFGAIGTGGAIFSILDGLRKDKVIKEKKA